MIEWPQDIGILYFPRSLLLRVEEHLEQMEDYSRGLIAPQPQVIYYNWFFNDDLIQNLNSSLNLLIYLFFIFCFFIFCHFQCLIRRRKWSASKPSLTTSGRRWT